MLILKFISFATTQPAQEDDLPAQSHASGKVGLTRQEEQRRTPWLTCKHALRKRLRRCPPAEIQGAPLAYGPAFQWLEAAWQLPTTGEEQPTAVLARLRRPDAVASVAGYPLHPALLDSCFQTTALVQAMTPPHELYLPFAVAEMTVGGLRRKQKVSSGGVTPNRLRPCTGISGSLPMPGSAWRPSRALNCGSFAGGDPNYPSTHRSAMADPAGDTPPPSTLPNNKCT